jgi:TolB-like protein
LKIRVIAFVLFIAAFSVYGQSGTVSLDGAISNSALRIQEDLSQGSTIIVYQFQSHNQALSDYVLKELFNKLVNSRKFTVLDRSEALSAIDAELDFQYVKSAGMINDDSLASLTKRLGAQAIVTGSLDDTGGEYRFRIRVIGTETTVAIVSDASSISKKDRRIIDFEPKQPANTGEKIGTGALNILFGLGSYLEGDISGGITLSAGFGVATILFIVEGAALDWDSPAVGVPATIGLTTAILSTVYGFARPFIYHHSPRVLTVTDNIMTGIVAVSDTYGNRNFGFNFSYTFKF